MKNLYVIIILFLMLSCQCNNDEFIALRVTKIHGSTPLGQSYKHVVMLNKSDYCCSLDYCDYLMICNQYVKSYLQRAEGDAINGVTLLKYGDKLDYSYRLGEGLGIDSDDELLTIRYGKSGGVVKRAELFISDGNYIQKDSRSSFEFKKCKCDVSVKLKHPRMYGDPK